MVDVARKNSPEPARNGHAKVEPAADDVHLPGLSPDDLVITAEGVAEAIGHLEAQGRTLGVIVNNLAGHVERQVARIAGLESALAALIVKVEGLGRKSATRPKAESELDPAATMTMAAWLKAEGPHQAYFAGREAGRKQATDLLSTVLTVYDPENFQRGHYLVADLRLVWGYLASLGDGEKTSGKEWALRFKVARQEAARVASEAALADAD